MTLLRYTTFWSVGAALASLSMITSVQAQTVFDADFEGPEYVPGTLVSDPNWYFDANWLNVEITDLDFASGLQSLRLTGGQPFDYFSDPLVSLPQVLWLDVSLKPVFADELELPLDFSMERTAVTGFVKVNAQGEIYAVDGDGAGSGQWISTGSTAVLNGDQSQDWMRLTYRLDYSTLTWDLFVDDVMVAVDLGFLNIEALRFDDFTLRGDDLQASGFDDFSIREDNPIFTDVDNDAIDDAYETAQGLDTSVNDRDADIDFDTLTNLQEFLLGSAASDPDTDGDGLHDGAEVAAGTDPSVAETHLLGSLPFAEDFESLNAGDLDSQSLWIASGMVQVQNSEVHSGGQALSLDGTSSPAEIQHLLDGNGQNPVWIDYTVKAPVYSDAESIPADPQADYYFLSGDQILVRDGENSWYQLPHAADSNSDGWQRVTRLNDYSNQTYQLWINGVLLLDHYGFKQTEPYLNQFTFTADAAIYLDDLSIGSTRPAGLDTDGDGLFDEDEDLNNNGLVDPGESDPFNPDTDGDGRSDSAAEILQLWLKADAGVQADSNGVLSQWDDQSIFKQHALVTGASTEAPILVEDFANGRPAVQFDGQDDFLLGASSFDINNSDYTAIIVQRRTGGDNRGSMLSYANGTSTATVLRWGQSHDNVGVYKGIGDGLSVEIDMDDRADELLVISARRSGGTPTGNGDTIDLRVLADESTWTANVVQSWQGSGSTSYMLGKIKEGNPNFFGGEILEVRVYKGALSDEETQLLEAELALQYGLTLDQNANAIADGWESQHFGRLLAVDEDLDDPDGDGLTTFREFNLGLDPNGADGSGFPLNDPNLKVWLSAGEGVNADANGNIVVWDDLSGNGIQVLPDPGSNAPSFEATGFNGEPTVYFDGNEAMVAATDRFDLADHDYTIVAIHAVDGVSNAEQSIISFRRQQPEVDAPSLGWLSATEIGEIVTAGSGQPITATVSNIDGGIGFASSVRRSADLVSVDHVGYTGNYAESGVRTPGAKGSTGFFLGTEKPNGGQELVGRIAEILVFDRSLSDVELADLIVDLRKHYGIVDDIDGDGLLNSEEDLNMNGIVDAGETDAHNNDSDGDGLLDAYDPQWVADPVADAAVLELQGDGSYATRFSFDTADGYLSGWLGGQQGWEAAPVFQVSTTDVASGDQSLQTIQIPYDSETESAINDYAVARHYLNSSGAPVVWVSFQAKLQYAILSEVDLTSNPAIALALSGDNTLAAYDSELGSWREAFGAVTPGAWVDYDLELDYTNKVWRLCIEGQTVFDGIPFVDPSRNSLEQFALLQQSGEDPSSWIDEIIISDTEPAGLDFDGDGLDNATERSIGSDLDSPDSDEDGMSDLYEHTYGLDIFADDASADPDGDGLSNAEEFVLGSDPFDGDNSGAYGFVRRDIWTGIPEGKSVSYLIEDPRYPLEPSLRRWSSDLDIHPSESSWNNYGQRIHGMIVAPETAEYTFWITGGQNCEFWLSTDATPFNKSLAAYLIVGTSYQNWYASSSQRSISIQLEAGQPYYFEMLHKEARGDDHLSLAWEYDGRALHIVTGDHLRCPLFQPNDLDQDGLPDDWEEFNGLDSSLGHSINGYAGDFDGDGLLNYIEYRIGTSPVLIDTDSDGITDNFEHEILKLDPTMADAEVELTPISFAGSLGIPLLGDWDIVGDILEARSFRGIVEYNFNIADSGVYIVEFDLETASGGTDTNVHGVEVYANDEYLGLDEVALPEGNIGTATFVSPWLGSGNNTLRLDWKNTESFRRIEIKQVRLFRITGEDEDLNGHPDWLDVAVRNRHGVIDGLNHQSHVSPACLEGWSQYRELVANSEDIEMSKAPNLGWYLNLPLNAGSITSVELSYESGILKDLVNVEWIETNVHESEKLSIRKGDSLLCTAYPVGSTEGSAVIEVVGQGTYTQSSSAGLEIEFDIAGVYEINTTHTNASGEVLIGSMEIEVVDASFAPTPVIYDELLTSWLNPEIDETMEVDWDSEILPREVSYSVAGAEFSLYVSSLRPQYGLLRNEPGGLILDSTEIVRLEAFGATSTSLRYVDSFEDGSTLVAMDIFVQGIRPGIEVIIEPFIGGLMFDDGTVKKTLTYEDFNELGQATVYFIKAPGALGANCHRLKIVADGRTYTVY